MAFDAGSIRTQAELDLAAFKANMTQLEANVAAVNKTLAGVQPVAPQIDAKPAQAQINLLQKAMQDLGQKFLGVKGTAQFDATDASKNVDGLTKSLGALAGQMGVLKAIGPLAGVLGAGSLIAVAGAATVALAQLGAEFKGFARTMQNASGATRDELNALRQSFDTVFRAGPVEGGALAQALPLISRRLKETGDQLSATTQAILAFSRVMGGDVVQNAELATRVFQGFQIAAEDQAKALDFVARAAQLTGESGQELLTSLKDLGPIARGLGLNFQESTALIAAFKDRGLEAGDATRGLTAMLGQAAKAGIDGRTAFESLLQVLREEPDATKAAEIATEAFGRRGAIVLAEMARTGDTDLQRFIDRVNATAPALETAAARGETASGRLQRAVQQIQATLAPVGEAIFTFSTSVLVSLIDQLNFVAGAAQRATEALAGLGKDIAAQLQAIAAARQSQDQSTAFWAAEAERSLQKLAAAEQEQATAQAEAGASGTAAAEGTQQFGRTSAEAAANVEKLTGKVASLAEQLAKLQDVGQIETLLQAADQTKVLDEAISSLTDRTVAASIVAMRNLALEVGQATGDWTLWDQAVQAATDHLAAQKATQAAATEEQRKAAAEVKAIEDAMQKASTVAQDTYFKRLEEIAKTLLPGLTAEQQTLVEQLLLTGQAFQAAQVAAAGHGQSLEALLPAIQGTTEQYDELKKKLEEVAKASDPDKLFRDELASRAKSVTGTLAGGFDAVTAASIKARAVIVGDMEAIAQALQAAGGDAQTFRDAWQAAMSGSAEDVRAFTEAAKNAVTFLATGRIPQVPAPPKDAVDAWADAMQKANEALQDATDKTAIALADAAGQLEQQRASILDTLAQAEADYQRTVADLAQQDAAARDAFNQGAADRAATFERAMADLEQSRNKAVADAQTATATANDDFAKSVAESAQTAADAIAAANQRMAETTEQANATMQAAWKQSAQALAALNLQQQQLTLGLSRRMQEITEQGLIGPQTQQQQNELAQARLQAQQDAALAQAGLTLQEQLAKGQFADAVDAADKQAQKQAQEIAKALAKVLADQQKKDKEAAEKRDKAIADADAKLQETLIALAKKQQELEAKYEQEKKKAEEAEQKRQADLQKKRDEAERKREQAEAKAAKDWAKADQQYAQRVRDIQQEQDKAAKAYQKAVTDANKDLQRAVQALEHILGQNNALLKQVLARAGIDMPVQFNNLRVEETGVDFLKVLVETGRQRLKEL